MIEFKKIKGYRSNYELNIAGQRVDAEVTVVLGTYLIRLTNATVTELFMSKHFSDLSVSPLRLESFPGLLEWWKASKKNNSIMISRIRETNDYRLLFVLKASANNWNRLWTFSDYRKEFESISESRGFPGQYLNEESKLLGGLEISPQMNASFVVDARDIIGDQITRCSEFLRQVHQETEKSLSAKLRADSVVMYFDFPGEVRIACEQYLLYFVQFLHELGIDAAAELKHDPGGILFAVTPTTAQDALDKVRLALDIYLRLPSGSIKDASSADGIEIQRLAANIQHLKGQLALASAIIQTKDATIETQRITIEHQLRLSSGEIVLDSLKVSNEPPGAADKEEIVDGIFSITKYQGKGFELNLAEIVRRLKEFFHRE